MSYTRHDNAIVEPGAQVGNGTRVWAFVNIKDGAVIGEQCNICDGCYVERGAVIGDHVTLKNNVAVFDGVQIDADVFVGANTCFINDRHPRSHRTDTWTLEKTIVKRGATLGSGSVIMCGVTVGEGSVVGAGSVVLKDVMPWTIVAGNPARFVGYACQCGQRLNTQYTCSCGRVYTLTGSTLKLVTDLS